MLNSVIAHDKDTVLSNMTNQIGLTASSSKNMRGKKTKLR